MTEQILPHQLPFALEAYRGLRVLSLDCFDTLLWRDCHAPADVFAALPDTSPLQRGWAEARARQAARLGNNRDEVSIAEIYAELMPAATPAEIAAAIAAELAAEAAACYAFAPAVALMRAAKARGLRVVVVSDSYLDARQLRALIAGAAGEAVAGLIDRVFASSEFGKGKGGGLYGDVLRKLAVPAETVLHIGDNPHADVEGVGRFGVQTLHLRQFGDLCSRRLRLESAIGAMFERSGPGAMLTAPQPHRAGLANCLPMLAGEAEGFGAAVLGPTLLGFELWLRAQAQALAARGGRVHWLFLMRDGHLPMRVHAATGGEAACGGPAHAVEISRFAAIAASFDREAKVQSYVERELGLRPETLARQLLFTAAEIDRLVAGRDPREASLALLREVRAGPRRRSVMRASRAYAQRLVAHVRASVAPAPGDTLMLIDLGYNGSVQNEIDGLLARELGVHVAGRYLLLRERHRPGLDKRGMISAEAYDPHALEALCANVAVLEQVCTADLGSVIDYTDAGAPLRRAVDVKGHQNATRNRIQEGCLAFARAQPRAVVRAVTDGPVVDGDAATEHTDGAAAETTRRWRAAATATLARLMFLPLPEELAVIERFEHDVNLGSDRTVALFDTGVATRGMRERGLFYMKGAERMYLPAELTGGGLSPRLALLAQQRFGLPLTFEDHCERALSLPVIHADGAGVVPGQARASATHDGYFIATVPIGDCRYAAALRFGALYEWVEVADSFAVPVDEFLGEGEGREPGRVACAGQLEGMIEVAPGLFRCEDEAGFMLFDPPPRQHDRPLLLAVVFRPIVARRAGETPGVEAAIATVIAA